MVQRFGGKFGGLLSLVLGVVLITGGAMTGTDSTVGNPTPTCVVQLGVVVPCPTGTIVVNEQAAAGAQQQASAAARQQPAARSLAVKPSSWTVLVTSTNCSAPNGLPVNQSLIVPTGGSANTDPLFVYTDPGHATSCSYQLAVTPAVGYTSKFSPTPPVTIPFTANRATGNTLNVALINTAIAVVTPTPTATQSSSAAPSSSADASDSESAADSASASPAASASSSAAPIAATGTSTPTGWTLALGVGLCLLGVVLLYGGRQERWRGRRTR